MSYRKDVFQSKVLQKLYPLPPKSVQTPSTPHTLETVPKKPKVQHDASKCTATGDGGLIPDQARPGRRVYSVLPLPAEYQTGAEGSVTLSQPTGLHTAGDPADEISNQSSEDNEEEIEEPQKRRRRRKKKVKTAPGVCSVKEKTSQADKSNTDLPSIDQTTEEGGERLSKNKRRKLKKKRHKEKLIANGVVPRAAAVEFTYQGEGEEEEEDEDEDVLERRSKEVSEFLRTTMEIFSSEHIPQVPPTVFEGLLSRISSRTVPPSVLRRIHTLKSHVQLKDTAPLAKALEEFQNSSSLAPEETTAVVSLIQYWITDMLTL